ncbi:MAG TPA: PEGA domain-containing protein [Thermoanaerobaculia bacterium]|nr:PEGA domain-containing protein [Thermoanaerobaculia bacterium]
MGAIDTDVSPEEARVYLDGRYIGIADDFDGYPDYLYLRRGHYRLEFKLDGYETKTVEIDARPGTKLDIDEKLHKIPGAKRYGSYETPTPEGGVQRFFGKRSGDSGQSVSEEDATPGDNSAPDDRDRPRASIEGEGRPQVSRDDRWRNPDNKEVSSPQPRVGAEPGGPPVRSRLRLHVEPADAAVYVDDRFVGTAEEVGSLERGIAVSPGKHTVTVSRPGFKDRSVDVEVGAGESHPLEMTLER